MSGARPRGLTARRAQALGLLLLLLLAATSLGLVLDRGTARALRADAKAWGAALAPPGLGSSARLSWSLRHVDPRLERGSNCDLYPLPGGPGFCPDQGMGLFAPPDEAEGLPRVSAAPPPPAAPAP